MRDFDWSLGEEYGQKIKRVPSPKENNDSDDFNAVEFSGNNIFFYSTVNRRKILKLNKAMINLGNNLATRAFTYNSAKADSIKLHINSYGGSVFAGLSAVDYILTSKVPVETIIEGCAASAATLMSVAGTKRYMHKNACMLVHQLSGHMWGKFQDMEDDMENSKMLMAKIKNIYREHTKIPEHKMDEILRHDLWWDADQCLEYGLVDEIL